MLWIWEQFGEFFMCVNGLSRTPVESVAFLSENVRSLQFLDAYLANGGRLFLDSI